MKAETTEKIFIKSSDIKAKVIGGDRLHGFN